MLNNSSVHYRTEEKQMPRAGYRSISVKDALFVKLQKKAESEHRTIPEMLEHKIENDC